MRRAVHSGRMVRDAAHESRVNLALVSACAAPHHEAARGCDAAHHKPKPRSKNLLDKVSVPRNADP